MGGAVLNEASTAEVLSGERRDVVKVAGQLLELVRDFLDMADLTNVTIAADAGCAWYAYGGILHPVWLTGTETEAELTGRAFELAHALIDAQPKSRSPSGGVLQ